MMAVFVVNAEALIVAGTRNTIWKVVAANGVGRYFIKIYGKSVWKIQADLPRTIHEYIAGNTCAAHVVNISLKRIMITVFKEKLFMGAHVHIGVNALSEQYW